MFKKNTSVTGFTVGFVSRANGNDVTTGTPLGHFTLDGGAQAAIDDVTPVHKGNGQWSFNLLASEMNGDIVGLTFTHVDGITQHFTIKTDTRLVSEVPTAFENQAGMATSAEIAALPTALENQAGMATSVEIATLATSVEIAALPTLADIFTTQLNENYAAKGDAPTLEQALLLMQQKLGDFAIVGSTITVSQLDGSTPAATYTLDDEQSPTSSVRAT